MKKLTSFLVVLTVVMVGTALFADSISHVDSQSAEYTRTLNRNASTGVDAVYFNPAATAFLDDGLYIEIGNDVVIENTTAKEFLTDMDGTAGATVDGDGERNSLVPYLGSFYAVYKTGPLAVNFAFLPFNGGGATFEGDTAELLGAIKSSGGDTSVTKISKTVMYLGPQLGVSYAINDMFAVNLSGKWGIYTGGQKIESDGALDGAEEDYSGNYFGGTLGLAAKPVEGLVTGIHFTYDSKFDATTETDSGETEAENQVSPKLGVGISYMAMENLKVETSFNYFFHSMVELDDVKRSDSYDNGYEAGIAFEYGVMDGLVASLGYLYSFYGMKDIEDNISLEAPDMNYHTFAVGAGYTVMEGLDINLGFNYRLYTSVESSSALETEYTKSRYTIGLGATYKAM